MNIKIVKTLPKSSMEPLTCTRTLSECQVAGKTLQELQQERLANIANNRFYLSILDDLWPSANFAETLGAATEEMLVKAEDGTVVAWLSQSEEIPETENSIALDDNSLLIKYPWDLLAINEEIVGGLRENCIKGTVKEGVTIDGFVSIGEGTILLPGVYIEGNVKIGENCKIGPNCYFRGSTAVGDNCHIGQAVEIKNSILMNNVGAGHLSYIGDSIIGENSNFGAGTITANFRHDGKNHRSAVDGVIIDTGRRKLGTIFGDDVHTGIHTSIYPGRKIWPKKSTLPGDIVKKDIK
jgi:acetyltransferase-like isoleucine patch superfamily enzyme